MIRTAFAHFLDSLQSPDKAVTAAYIAFFGTLLTLFLRATGQMIGGVSARHHATLVARTSLYAEVRRTLLTTQGHIDFVHYDKDGWNGMIWLVVFPTLFPSAASLDRINRLTAREVRAITSFYFVYKETIGFLKASALEILPLVEQSGPANGTRRSPMLALDMDMIEYVYMNGVLNGARRADLLRRLRVIEAQSQKALRAITATVLPRYRLWPSQLGRLVRQDAEDDSSVRARRRTDLRAELRHRITKLRQERAAQPPADGPGLEALAI